MPSCPPSSSSLPILQRWWLFLDAVDGSEVLISGGNFTCNATAGGGFLYTSHGARVDIEGGTVQECVAGTSGGAVSSRMSRLSLLAGRRDASHFLMHVDPMVQPTPSSIEGPQKAPMSGRR